MEIAELKQVYAAFCDQAGFIDPGSRTEIWAEARRLAPSSELRPAAIETVFFGSFRAQTFSERWRWFHAGWVAAQKMAR